MPGIYKLQTQVVGSSIAGREFCPAPDATVVDAGSTNGLNHYVMTLSAGVYELKFTNVGSQQADMRWLLKIESLDWEKIFNNGVSQSSALSLMMFAPPEASAVTQAETGLLSIPPSANGDAFGGSVGPVPSSLLVTLNTALAGQPSWNGQAFAGASFPAETETGSSPGQAINAGFSPLFASGDEPINDDEALTLNTTKDRTAEGGPILSKANTVQPDHNADSNSSIADIRALTKTEWVTRIGSLVQDWFMPSREFARSQLAETESLFHHSRRRRASTRAVLLVNDPAKSWRNRHFISVARGDLGATAGLIMVGAVAYRLRLPISRWWQANRQHNDSRNRPRARALSGPHPVLRMSRLKTHVRRP